MGVMVLSSIALGMMDSSEFFELALRLDPVNEFAARLAIKRYRYGARCSDVRRIASNLVHRLPRGTSRNHFMRELASASQHDARR